MTSKDLKMASKNICENGRKVKMENYLKCGSVLENIEINDQKLDENLHNNIPELEVAMQNFSNNKAVRNDTVQDLKEFNSQTLATQAKQRGAVSFCDDCYKKSFRFNGL